MLIFDRVHIVAQLIGSNPKGLLDIIDHVFRFLAVLSGKPDEESKLSIVIPVRNKSC